MNGPSIWWVVQGVATAATAVALVYALWLQRSQSRSARAAAKDARERAHLSLQAAELQAQSIQSARAAVEAAARVQRLASRPALKVGLSVQGLMADVGRTPVIFALRLQNVGHGTAVIEQVRLLVRGEVALTYHGGGAGGSGASNSERLDELTRRIESEVFQRAVGSSLQSLSGKLTVMPLAEDARALEASGSLDLLRVQVFAHNAEAVEQGLTTLSAEVSYRDLDGGHYTSADQFRSL